VDDSRTERLRRRLRDDDAGFGLVEVVVAMGIFAGVTVGILATTLQATKTTFDNRQRSVAANLASQEMDRVRSTNVADLPVGLEDSYYDADLELVPSADDLTDAGVAYHVQRRSEWVSATSTDSPCTATTMVSGTSVAFLSVQVQVDWPRMGGVAPVRSDTVVTPPVGAFDRNSGNVPVRVFDGDGAPRVRQSVDLYRKPSTGAETLFKRIRTDEQGCAFFSFAPVGDYVVVVDGNGLVDKKSTAPSRSNVSVVAGQTAGATVVELGEASTLRVRLPGDNQWRLPCGLKLVAANDSLLDAADRAGQRLVNATTCAATPAPVAPSSQPLPVPGLYPYTDGVDVWLGDCRDSDPSDTGWGTSARDRQNAELTPGEDSDVLTLNGRRVELHVTRTDNRSQARPNQRVVLFHAAESGTGGRCSTTRTFELGVSDANGRVYATVPYGKYNVRLTPTGGNVTMYPTAADNGSSFTQLVVGPNATTPVFANLRVAP
jgi:type II secretory pathway pseudopilin PulG